MAFSDFLTQTASVQRLTKITGTKKENYQSVGSILCMIQPLGAEETRIVEGVFGKTFRMFCHLNADIKDTDKITVDNQDYLIKGISDYHYGTIPHKEVVIQSVIE